MSLASAPVYNMSLTYREWLFAVGNVLKGKLVRLLSLGEDRQFEPQRNMRACNQMMLCMTRRVAAGLAAMRDIADKEAEELCALGYCAAAIVPPATRHRLGQFTLTRTQGVDATRWQRRCCQGLEWSV